MPRESILVNPIFLRKGKHSTTRFKKCSEFRLRKITEKDDAADTAYQGDCIKFVRSSTAYGDLVYSLRWNAWKIGVTLTNDKSSIRSLMFQQPLDTGSGPSMQSGTLDPSSQGYGPPKRYQPRNQICVFRVHAFFVSIPPPFEVAASQQGRYDCLEGGYQTSM